MNRLGSSVLTGVPLLSVDELIERIDDRGYLWGTSDGN
jgi:hypothetical protein